MSIVDGRHILVSTFEPDQDTVEQVVQASDLRLGWWSDDQAVAQRFAGDQIVMVRACNRGGKPDLETPLLEGRAEVVLEGPLVEEIRAAIAEKYGAAAVGEGVMDRVRGMFHTETKPGFAILINVTA